MAFRKPAADDENAVLALNRECEAMLSPLTMIELQALLAGAYYARVTDDVTAMLIAFDERSSYASPNFAWFQARYPRFVYVDRVAVSQRARGGGIARALYSDLIATARAEGQTLLGCEIYSDPPNPVSDAFHASMGFTEVGSAYLPDRDKTVRYLVRDI